MDEFMREALAIIKAQAGVREMTEEEMMTMLQKLTVGIRAIMQNEDLAENIAEPPASPGRSIKERTITCLECGKLFKVITKKHLSQHGLTPAEYREKWNIKKDVPLVSKGLQRERRKKMKEMRLWEKRKRAA